MLRPAAATGGLLVRSSIQTQLHLLQGGILVAATLLAGCVRVGFAPGDGVAGDRGISEARAGDSRSEGFAKDGPGKDSPATDGPARDGGGTVTHSWSKRFGGPGYHGSRCLAVDGIGNLFVTGAFESTVDFGGGALASAGGQDIFVASFAPTGAHRWSQRFGGSGTDAGNRVAVDGSGNVFVTGDFQGTVDFGGGALASAGDRDIFVASYGPTGAHRWSQRFGGSGPDSGSGVAVDGSGNVFVTGDFQGTVDFGGGALASAGGSDIFLLRLSP